MIAACFCAANTPPGGEIAGHRPGEGKCERTMPSDIESTLEDDPERFIQEGDEDPFEGEISDEPCGAATQIGPNSWNKVTCDRDPHPRTWLHIAVVDDQVEHAWRDPLPDELPLLKISSEGVQFSCCGWLVNADGEHASNCPAHGTDREPEGTQPE